MVLLSNYWKWVFLCLTKGCPQLKSKSLRPSTMPILRLSQTEKRQMSRVARLLDWNCKRAASIAVDQIAPLNCHRENMLGMITLGWVRVKGCSLA